MSTQKPGSLVGMPDLYTRIGEIELALEQHDISVSALTEKQRAVLIHYAQLMDQSLGSCVGALVWAWGRSTSTQGESISGICSSTTRRWVDVPLF